MERKSFIRSTALGLCSLSLIPLANSCQKEPKKESEDKPAETEKPEILSHKIVKKDDGIILNVLGDNQNIKLTGEDTNGQYTLIEQYNEPGIGIPPHVHDNEDEVFQVLEGQVEMSVGNKTTIMNAGDIIFCPKGVPHSWRVIGEEKARAMLSIFPAGLEKMFVEISELPAGPPDMEKVTAICEKYNLRFV